jgi:hypothetical protein
LYTELLQQAHYHPHRFPALEPDGQIRSLRVLCIPHHESLDRTTAPEDTNDVAIIEAGPRWARIGGLMQVMNHPDIHLDELFHVLSELPRGGREDLSAQAAMDWWRRTHVATNLLIAHTADDAVAVTTREPVDNLVLELLAPDGTVRRHVLSSAADQTSTVTAAG